MSPLTATFIWTALQITILALATLGVYAIARRLSPHLSAAVLATGLGLALVLTLLAASPWPRWQLAREQANPPVPPVAEEVAIERSDAPATEPVVATAPELPAVDVEPFTLADYAASMWAALQQPPVAAAPEKQPTNWLLRIVLAGVTLGVVRLVWGLASVRRLMADSQAVDDPDLNALITRTSRQLGITRSITVRDSPHLGTPATVGWWRPSLLLPAHWFMWTDDERRVVIAHELAHIAGRDFAGWIIARVVVALHFYHPLVHWLAGRLQLEQELAADATAAQLLGDRKQYLHTLAGLALATPHHNLSGPARALIPGRSLLMRRVEMLRSPLRTIGSQLVATRLRWAQFAVLALVAVGIAGLRAPNLAEAQTAAPAEIAKSGTAVERIPLSLVPPETIYVLSVRPAELFASETLKPLAEKISASNLPLQEAGLKVQDIAELMFCVPKDNERYVVRMTTREACDQLLTSFIKWNRMTEVAGAERATWRTSLEQYMRLDERTFVVDKVRSEPGFTVPPISNPVVAWEAEWTSRASEQVVVAFNNRHLWKSLPAEEKTRLANRGLMPMIMPALQQVDMAFANITVDDDLRIGGVITTDSPESAEKVKSTLQAMITLGQNALDNALDTQRTQKVAQAPPEMHQALEGLMDEGGKLLRGAKVEVEGNQVTVSYVGKGQAAEVAVAAGLMLPAVEEARMAARRNVITNNMKHLALAVHNYHDTYKRLPAASSKRHKGGESQYPHSWRVAILPFLEQQALYDQYRFEEPWNSEANLKVLEQMPEVFRDPNATGDKHNTTYFALTGPETLFPSDEKIGFAHVSDGLSNTLLFVEAKRDIPWTKPEDIPYAKEAAVPELGGHYADLFLAAFGDGSVRPVSLASPEATLRAMITRAGGEPIASEGIFVPDNRLKR